MVFGKKISRGMNFGHQEPRQVLALSLELEAPDAVISNEFADLNTSGTKGHHCRARLPAGRRGGELACHKEHYPAVCRGEKKRSEAAAWGRHKSNLGFAGLNSSQSCGIFSYKFPRQLSQRGHGFYIGPSMPMETSAAIL